MRNFRTKSSTAILLHLVLCHEGKAELLKHLLKLHYPSKVDRMAEWNLFTDHLNTDLSAISRRLTDRLSNCLREGGGKWGETEREARGRRRAAAPFAPFSPIAPFLSFSHRSRNPSSPPFHSLPNPLLFVRSSASIFPSPFLKVNVLCKHT